ncbi:sporulenol synthase [Evansella caseinilytica]|uniref:Sporulenol synthase n=1 Tax=Evansella caseinilytica TaxID=1503961 RepID=A0A1H3UY07_9BACI|nr:prenyltransferase/squalene oxidase repeat-containing protein [Evansella caseinilytica]SDZ66871.1 sporulenol synthase [Evansella caseinilytica]
MTLKEKVTACQKKLIDEMTAAQQADGSWRYPCETGPMTDAYMIIVMRALKAEDEQLIQQLTGRLLSIQKANGAWKIYEDEVGGNLSATIEAYTALLFADTQLRHSEQLKRAADFITENGGMQRAHAATKFMLALNGLYPWPAIFPIPLSLLLLPKASPVHFERLTSYVKVHFAAVLIAANKRFTLRNDSTPDLSHLLTDATILRRLKNQLATGPAVSKSKQRKNVAWTFWQKKAVKKAEQYLLERIEDDGTLGSYASATFYLIYSLLASGYEPQSPLIQNAVSGLKSLSTVINGKTHIQNAGSTIWDTALMSYSLQQAGVAQNDRTITKSTAFLLKNQQYSPVGQLRKNGRALLPITYRAWGFSENNSCHPDVDDTQAVLRAVAEPAKSNKVFFPPWNHGLKWLLAMQNKDGGWSAFDKNLRGSLITMLPVENIQDTAVDPSTADLTGRTLEFLGNCCHLKIGNASINKAVQFLLKHQKEDGSWYGRWGVCYIYGTWAAVTGLCAAGVPKDAVPIQKAVSWLLSVQNDDGGWGESCQSDKEKRFVPLPFSTPSQTAWAVDALLAAADEPEPEVERGIKFLLKNNGCTYPTGGGLPGHFYLHYHSYNKIWPLAALSHYLKKAK